MFSDSKLFKKVFHTQTSYSQATNKKVLQRIQSGSSVTLFQRSHLGTFILKTGGSRIISTVLKKCTRTKVINRFCVLHSRITPSGAPLQNPFLTKVERLRFGTPFILGSWVLAETQATSECEGIDIDCVLLIKPCLTLVLGNH